MRQMRAMTSGCVLLALVLAVAGCATPLDTSMPGENVRYARGGTEGDVRASIEQVIESAEAVMAQMQMDVGEPEREESEVGDVLQLRGRSASGRRVYITAIPGDEGISRLRVRIDQFGDQRLSNELYRRIASRLQ